MSRPFAHGARRLDSPIAGPIARRASARARRKP
jgi:hypothetical protein